MSTYNLESVQFNRFSCKLLIKKLLPRVRRVRTNPYVKITVNYNDSSTVISDNSAHRFKCRQKR